MKRFFDGLAHVLEYFLVAVFLLGAIGLIGQEPLTAPGVLVLIFGGQIAFYIYLVWFTFLALAMVYAKLRRKKKLHKFTLMAMYLTTIYTAILSGVVFDTSWQQVVDDVVVGLVSAMLWLRWKLTTEYIDPNEYKELVEAHNDSTD